MDEVGRDEEGPPRVGTEGGIVKKVGQVSPNKKNEKRCSKLIRFRVCKVASSVVGLLWCWIESRCIILMLSVVARARDRDPESLSSTD